MNILYDHQAFSLQEFGGISRYFSELIQGVNQYTAHNAFLSTRYTNNVYAHDLHLVHRRFFPDSNFPKKMPVLYRINKAFSTYDLATKPYDLVHATYYDPYFLRYSSRRPTTVTFFDMIHERFGNQFAELSADRVITARKREVAKRASHIIAISESTKADIIDLFDTDPNKISVVYLGSSFKANTNPIHKTPRINTVKPYLLFVGHRGYYKNFIRFLTAIEPLLQGRGINVVCAGGGAFSKDEEDHISTLRLTDYISQQPINDQILRKLYSDALLFVFPSLYEGFGIPVLEAFSCDCPCAVSNCSSLPEVGGDAVLYFNPTDVDSIRESIQRLVDSQELRVTLIEKGREQLTKFSWQSTVRETIHIYERL